MKAFANFRLNRSLVAAFTVSLVALACEGVVVEPDGKPAGTAEPDDDPTTDPEMNGGGGRVGSGSGTAGRGSSAGSGTAGVPGAGAAPGGGADDPKAGARDVNRVAIHRLNNAEYDNTVRDLLGITSKPGAGFIDDEKLFGFDNIAAAFGMSDARYEQYFNAADALVEEAFAKDELRDRIVTCTPSGNAVAECARTILEPFAKRAFRRRPSSAELERLVSLVTDASALGEDFEGGIRNALKAILASADFLYRIELDSDPESETPHALGGNELATRLSYLVWSTMPDDALMRKAESGDLLADDVLESELERLLADSRSAAFLENFAGQWLGLRALNSHQVDTNIFPEWKEPLRAAMVQEGLRYFDEFVSGDRPMSEFFTADVNFVNAPLAELYGMAKPSGQALRRVTETDDDRRGFMGLAGFLTLTSFSQRTAPTLRGKWVLENLLCTEIPPPPADVPELEQESGGAQSENVRERLAEHSTNSTCAGCHRILDPIGLGLENFDAIGRSRDEYANGDAIDATGELPTGETFNGLLELSEIVSKDERLTDCAVRKLMTYALSREIVATDAAYVAEIERAWIADGLGVRALLKRIVLNDTFRFRRGEAP